MWALCVLAYAAAVFQRTSFGVASGLATERFAAGASVTSLFVVVQLITYAAMQVPVGLMTDRWGTRAMVSTGALLMCAGQLALAVSPDLTSAILARVLVGAGDAMTFTAVLRLLPFWFPPGRIPLLNQVTSMLGQFGQLGSSLPLVALLTTAGWTRSFLAAATVSAVVGALLLIVLRNYPDASSARRSRAGDAKRSVRAQIVDVFSHPASRVAFWIHWMCGFWPMVFALMWGYPFLLDGQGYSSQVTAGLFTLYVFAGVPAAIVVGIVSRRAPLQRVNLALMFSLLAVLPWLVVLLLPGPAPVWLMAVLMIGISAAGPGSGIGFDVARASNPLRSMGTATGIVIVGGFTAGVLGIFVIGLVLDAFGSYSLTAFRWAMAAQFAVWGVGVVGVYVERRRARRQDARRGVRYPSLRTVLVRELSALGDVRLRRNLPTDHTPMPHLTLQVRDGREVAVAAVLPGTGRRLVAIDLPPADADATWWRQRVRDYLDLVATPRLEIGGIEVRCPTRAARRQAQELIADALSGETEPLTYEVVVVPYHPT